MDEKIRNIGTGKQKIIHSQNLVVLNKHSLRESHDENINISDLVNEIMNTVKKSKKYRLCVNDTFHLVI